MNSLSALRILSFFSLIVFSSCWFNPAIENKLNAQGQDSKTRDTEESDSAAAKPKSALNEKLKAAIDLGEIEVKLTPMVPSKERTGLQFAPKAGTIKLSKTDEGLSGFLTLAKKDPIKVTVEFDDPKAIGGIAHLKIDVNGNSKFEDGEIHKIDAVERRGKFWYSSPDVTISLETTDGDATNTTRPYPIALWHTVNPKEPEKEPTVRWTRKGWHQAEFKLGDRTCTAVIGDFDLDGFFGDRDTWGIGKTAGAAWLPRNSIYKVNKHAWFDSVAYRITSVDKNGTSIKIRAVDVGMTQAEEKAQKDPFAKDKKYPRSESPVVFIHDYKEALALAKKEDKRVVIDFVTTWCGPCHSMDRHVYTAKPVFDKSSDVIFLKLDGDDERELNKQYKIKGYPTLILLDSAGKEIRRRSGYQGVAKLLDFLE